MIIINHACDAVKPESVELILFKPVTAVGEQEVNHAVLAIIEAQ